MRSGLLYGPSDDGFRGQGHQLRPVNKQFLGTDHGVFTDRPGTLSYDALINLLEMGTRVLGDVG